MIEKLTCLPYFLPLCLLSKGGLACSFFLLTMQSYDLFQSVTNKNAEKRRKTCVLLIYVNNCVRTHIKSCVFCVRTQFLQ